MKVALGQLDATVADLRGNADLILAAAARAAAAGAELVVFPEQALCGYPALDLWEDPEFLRAGEAALKDLARRSRGGPALLVGALTRNPSRLGKPAFNSAALLDKGKVAALRHKTLLPTYDVFDEARYFEPARGNLPILHRGVRLGVSVCEDAWVARSPGARRLYASDPVRAQAKTADLLINLSASPFERGKARAREALLCRHAKAAGLPFLYCNLVGGNDEIVFDGRSLVLDARGRVAVRARAFASDLVMVDTERLPAPAPAEALDEAAEVGEALVLGISGYARKCGFQKAFVGLSGGIDSAVVGALAARALGPENVTGVSMPSEYSSPGSVTDAEELARNLGIRILKIPINGPYGSLRDAVRKALGEKNSDDVAIWQQNLQSRVRGTLLMALANKENGLLLATGNKSELSVGYCTLYGDMSGGLAVLADAPKHTVYALAHWLNRQRSVIPESSISKAPSAELKPDQKDQDDLPPYDQLDDILTAYIEERLGPAAIARRGHAPALVAKTLERIDRAEYKRRQAPPSLKVSAKAFGVGRRMPIAKRSFRETAP